MAIESVRARACRWTSAECVSSRHLRIIGRAGASCTLERPHVHAPFPTFKLSVWPRRDGHPAPARAGSVRVRARASWRRSRRSNTESLLQRARGLWLHPLRARPRLRDRVRASARGRPTKLEGRRAFQALFTPPLARIDLPTRHSHRPGTRSAQRSPARPPVAPTGALWHAGAQIPGGRPGEDEGPHCTRAAPHTLTAARHGAALPRARCGGRAMARATRETSHTQRGDREPSIGHMS